MILYIRGFPATDLVKYDGSLDDSYLGIILVQLLSTILKKKTEQILPSFLLL